MALAARTESELSTVAREIMADGKESGADVAHVCPADVNSPAEVKSLVETIDGRWGHLDLLVHAAGYGRFLSLEDTDREEWELMLATNLTAVFALTRAALPLLRGGKNPLVVGIVSVAGIRAFPNCAAYCASKFGLRGLLAVMREELRKDGIRVTSILPGATDTPFWDHISGEWDRSRMIKPSEIARLVVAAAEAPPEAALEEIVVAPSGGDL